MRKSSLVTLLLLLPVLSWAQTFSLDYLVHLPSEWGSTYLITAPQMRDGDTAYYRDIVIGARFFIGGLNLEDGHYWESIYYAPDGTARPAARITFYRVLGSYRNCFVASGLMSCNMESALVVTGISRPTDPNVSPLADRAVAG